MKMNILINIVALLIACSIQSTTEEKHSLEILRPLKNGSYAKNKKVKLICEVKNATLYRWYKDDKLLKQDDLIVVNAKGRKLVIKKFSQRNVGVYKCEGQDKNGNFAKTSASLTLERRKRRVKNRNSKEGEDKLNVRDPCKPQTVENTECINFDERKCPNVTSFAPKAENLNVEIQLDKKTRPSYKVNLLVRWNVPRAGRDSIWGWQIRIFGGKNMLGYQTCSQVNRPKRWPNGLQRVFRVPSPARTYKVEIQGLPNFMEPYNKTVVRKTVEVPGLCDMVSHLEPACCVSYVNASLGVGKHNRTTLFWKTYYPARLNVTIDGFIVKWFSQPDKKCDYDAVYLDPVQSNYTFRNLTSKCGNYTIQLKLMFSRENVKTFGCKEAPTATVSYISPSDKSKVTEVPPSPSQRTEAIATAGFVIAAIFGGIFIVVLIYLCKKRKGRKCDPPPLSPISKETVKVFILNPNHCDLCTEVVQALGLLLIETGHIRCDIDMFVPPRKKCKGLASWTQDMILDSDYVIIPWMCEINQPQQVNTAGDMNTLRFLSSLDMIQGELLRNRDRQDKFIPVCLDHCSLEILPSTHLVLQTYNIPSKIDDLVIELIGKTRRRPDTQWPILQFDDKNYKVAKGNLEKAVNRMKKNHHQRLQKNLVSDALRK